MDKKPSEEQFVCFNIRDFLNSEEFDGIGENDLERILSDFSSPLNSDVEFFLKRNAVEFTKKNQSVTYLVFSLEDMCLVGYFSITMKPVTVNTKGMSNSVKRKLSRLSHFDQCTDSYTVSAYLIAQLGRNYSGEVKYPITGRMLMNFAVDTLHDIQRQLGGLMVYLECEEKEPLLKFYQEQNGFRLFGERLTEGREGESHKLLQLLNFL